MLRSIQTVFKLSLTLLIFVVAVSLLGSVTALAACEPQNLSISSGAACAQGNGQPSDLFGANSVFNKITNILLFLVGAISVIMLIIGGIRYVISGGDQAQVTGAK